MKLFNLRQFTDLMAGLESLRSVALVLRDESLSKEPLAVLSQQLRDAVGSFSELGLVVSAGKSEIVCNQLGALEAGSTKMLGQTLEDLAQTVQIEMAAHLFMYIEPTKAYYYSGDNLFGSEVSACFPSIEYDIEEAGKCLALNRSSACVFHLMRVLEVGLYTMAEDLSIENIQENWQNTIEQIEKAIRGLPKPDERKASYADAATHFMYVKDAWRNRTMHVGRVYTDEKAQQIFDNTKGFMQALATRLSEKTSS